MSTQAVNAYLQKLRSEASSPTAHEHSYRPAFQKLVEGLASHLGRPLANITLEPGSVTGVGAPDAALYATQNELIGYVETKDLTKDLDNLNTQEADQFGRYIKGFTNWIFTDYVEFRLYQDGSEVERVDLCPKAQIKGTASLSAVSQQQADALTVLFDRFLSSSIPGVESAQKLAGLLAHKARLMENVVNVLLTSDVDQGLQAQLESYRRWLIPDLIAEDFADLYAETLTYGLFLAAYENERRQSPLPFERNNLLDLLPVSVPPVRTLFELLAARLLPRSLDWIIDDIMQLLDKADMGKIKAEFMQTGSKDPTVHLYETFLNVYDSNLRETRGVYYTPDAVVDFMVRSADGLLKRHFGKSDGLASAGVTLLDPAVGTGAFLSRAYEQVRDNFGVAHAGDLPDHLRSQTLDSFYGFELLAAPYVLSHLKLGQSLSALGVNDGTPRVYLTNTLAEHALPQSKLPGVFEQSISEDGYAAAHIKEEQKVLVIMGNPPYSGESYNEYSSVDDYKFIGGEPLGERNTKWLQNDYVKFVRWSEKKIAEFSENGAPPEGVVTLITDNSYLSAPLFRGMRRHLLDKFSQIYVLNLHGKSRPPEVVPPGVAVDRNIFNIQQGVSIVFLVRESSYKGAWNEGLQGSQNEQASSCSGKGVFYADSWGTAQEKLEYLSSNGLDTIQWNRLSPEPPYYAFVERDPSSLAASYYQWPQVTDLFPVNSLGIVTARDKLTIADSEQDMQDTVSSFSSLQPEEARQRFGLGEDKRDWKVHWAQEDLKATGPSADYIRSIAYRPFDARLTYYTGKTKGFICMPRKEVMRHLLGEGNLALVTLRNTRKRTPMRAFVTRTVADARLLSSEANCTVLPLFSSYYENPEEEGLGVEQIPTTPARVMRNCAAQYEVQEEAVDAREIFFYVYGVLNAQGYQSEFEEELGDDYPRIPFTDSYEDFVRMAAFGRRLCELHLLEAPDLQSRAGLSASFPVSGSGKVARGYPKSDYGARRVYINSEQYFEGVTEAMCEYEVGGYRPLEKYLDDRKGEVLDLNTRLHYATIATSIEKVLETLPEVEEVWRKIISGAWFDPLSY